MDRKLVDVYEILEVCSWHYSIRNYQTKGQNELNSQSRSVKESKNLIPVLVHGWNQQKILVSINVSQCLDFFELLFCSHCLYQLVLS